MLVVKFDFIGVRALLVKLALRVILTERHVWCNSLLHAWLHHEALLALYFAPLDVVDLSLVWLVPQTAHIVAVEHALTGLSFMVSGVHCIYDRLSEGPVLLFILTSS